MIRNRFSRMNKFRKRAFAAALATAVISTSLNIGSIAVSAGTSARGRVIVAFEELTEDVADQTLPIGGKKSDINFPDELDVLLYSEDADRDEQEDEEPRDSTDIREQEDETPSDNSSEEPSDVSEQENTDDTDPDDVRDNDSTDSDSSQDETSGETTEEIPSVEDERIVEDESRDDGSDAGDGSDGNTYEGGNEESDTADETESDDSTGEPDDDSDDGASAKLIDTAVILVPVNDCRRQEFTGTAYTAAKFFETAVNFGREYNGIRNMVAPVRAYAAEPDSNEADNTDADDNTGEGDSDSSGDEGGLRRLADGERRTLEDVRWKLIKNKSEYGSRFQAVRAGDVFYFAPDISAYGLKSDADLPEIRVTIVTEDGSVSGNEVSENEVSENEVSENSISENSVSENEIVAFDQFMIVSGVKVAVTAPEGVFPKDAVLKVKKVDDAASNEKIEQTLKEDMGLSDAAEVNGEAPDRSEDESTEGSSTSETLNYITFDITITDVSGNEIQPDTEYGNAEVTFSQVDIISDYLDAPGEETGGKLNDGEDDDSDENKGAGKDGVIIIGGHDDTTNAKKTLRVYHFEDGLEDGERLDSDIDESDSAVTVSAEHFSDYTIAIGINGEDAPQVCGDFKVTKCEGARIEAMYDASNQNVTMEVCPSVSTESEIEITLNDVTETGQTLILKGEGSGIITNISLNNVKQTSKGNGIQINNFNDLSLSLNNYVVKDNAYDNYINIKGSSGKILLDNARIYRGILIHEGSKIEIYTVTESTIGIADESDRDPAHAFYLENGSSLYLTGDNEYNSNNKLILTPKNRLFKFSGTGNNATISNGNYYIKTDAMEEGGTSGANDSLKINIKGGFIDADVSHFTEAEAGQSRASMEISGGTHKINKNFLFGKNDSNNTNSKLTITGGSIHITDTEGITEIIGDASTKYQLHTIEIRDSSDKGVGGKKVTNTRGTDFFYSTTDDCYTDDDGKLYFWYIVPTDAKYRLRAITIDGENTYAYSHQEAEAPRDDKSDNRYAMEGSQTNVFYPFYITDIKLDQSKLVIGDNKLKDILTFVCSDGSEHKGSDIEGEYIIGVYDRLKDICWSVHKDKNGNDTELQANTDGTGIVNNYNDDVTLRLGSAGPFYLRVDLNDTKIRGGDALKWIFRIPDKYIPVTDITLSSTPSMTAGTGYTLDDKDVLEAIATVVPSNASETTIQWSVKAPGESSFTDVEGKSYTPAKAGTYILKATITDGLSEEDAKDFEKEFTVLCSKDIGGCYVAVTSPVNYTGAAVTTTVTIKDGDTTLKEGTDYTLTYSNNVNEGTDAKVEITGKGLYTGSTSKPFTIRRLPTGTITIAGQTYSELQTKDGIAAYVNKTAKGAITAKPAENKNLKSTEYYWSDKYYSNVADLETAAGSNWTALADATDGETSETTANSSNYFYVRITDDDEDKGVTYLSTQNVIDDETAPGKPLITSGIVSGSTGTVSVKADDNLSGIGNYYVMAVNKGEDAPTVDQVKSYGVKSSTSPVTISGLSSSKGYTFYAVAEDKAGNFSDISAGKDSEVQAGKISGTISVMGHTYDSMQGKEETETYTNESKEIKVTASAENGVKSVEYIITDKFYASEKAIGDSGWSVYDDSSRPYLLKNKLNYIYAKITDNGGGTAIISSKGIWEDETAPVTSSIKTSMKEKSGTVTVAGTDGESGVAAYYLLYNKKGGSAPSASKVKSSGKKSITGKYKISGLTKGQSYVFYAVTVDKAGNISAIKSVTGTTDTDPATITIAVGDLKYDELQGKQEVEEYYPNEPKKITITAKNAAGTSKIQYFITDTFYTSETAIEGAATKTVGTGDAAYNVSLWSTYNDSAKPYLIRNKLNYIYAKVTDTKGNTVYVSSKGIWEDEIIPKVSSIKTTHKDTTCEAEVKGKDDESGIENYYILAKTEKDTAPRKPEDVKGGEKSDDGKFRLEGLTANTKYTLYAVIEDKAGNLSEIKKGSVTTAKSATPTNAAAAAAGVAGAGGNGSAGGSGSGSGAGSGSASGTGSNVDKRTAAGSGLASENETGDDTVDESIRDGVPYISDGSDGILTGRDKTSGWDRIESEIAKASVPAEIYINMSGETKVPADVFRKIAAKDVTCYFIMNDDITWAVNGLSFTDIPKDIDFRVRTDTKNIPSRLINEVADVYPHKNLTLEHDGEFGFTAILSVNVGKDNADMYANLYYYDEDENGLDFIDSKEVDGRGRASFELEHASDYTVILRGDALTDKSAAALMSEDIMDMRDGQTGANVITNVSRSTGRLWLIVVSVISFMLCGLILFMPERGSRRRRVARSHA